MFRKHGTTFDVVSNQRTDFQGTQQELAEDLLSVCNYFVAKNNGRRAAANVRNRQEGVLKTPNMSSTSTQRKITKAFGNRVLTRKVKLNVRTEKDQNWLNKAFGNARWNYNKAVEMMNNPTTRNEQKESGLS